PALPHKGEGENEEEPSCPSGGRRLAPLPPGGGGAGGGGERIPKMIRSPQSLRRFRDESDNAAAVLRSFRRAAGSRPRIPRGRRRGSSWPCGSAPASAR